MSRRLAASIWSSAGYRRDRLSPKFHPLMDAQIEDAARRFEQLADSPDPDSATADDPSDLRATARRGRRQ